MIIKRLEAPDVVYVRSGYDFDIASGPPCKIDRKEKVKVDNEQLTLIILGSVFVGALIPLLFMMAVAVHRASTRIAEIGAQLIRTLTHVETISNRVEALSRGLEGKETSIADLLTSVGHVAQSIERNVKIINIFSTMLASVGTLAADFIKNRFTVDKTSGPASADVSDSSESASPNAEGASP